MIIKTLSTFRNYIMEFDVGKEFEEDLAGVDDRKCMVRIRTVTTDKIKTRLLRLCIDCIYKLLYLWLFLKLYLYCSVC